MTPDETLRLLMEIAHKVAPEVEIVPERHRDAATAEVALQVLAFVSDVGGIVGLGHLIVSYMRDKPAARVELVFQDDDGDARMIRCDPDQVPEIVRTLEGTGSVLQSGVRLRFSDSLEDGRSAGS